MLILYTFAHKEAKNDLFVTDSREEAFFSLSSTTIAKWVLNGAITSG